MDIPKVLSSAAKIKATEARVAVGEPTVLVVRGELRTLFASMVEAGDFEDGIVRRLDAFTREQLRATGRCQWQFEEKGIGKIQAEIEPTKARFLLPTGPTVRSDDEDSTEERPAESQRSLFSKIFGRK